MVKRDFIRNILLVLLAVLALLLLRVFVFSNYRVRQADANNFLKSGDLVTITKNEKPNYKDFVVYKVAGKDRIGRIIGKPKDSVTYMDDIFYLNHKAEDQSYINDLKNKYHTKNGENLVIGFNAQYVIDVLKNIDDDEVKMLLNTPITPCLIEPLEGNEYKYLVLPVRIN